MLKQFKRLYNFYFRISAIIFGKQSMRNGRSNQCVDKSRIPIPLNANNNLADATSDDQQM
jgi:hypothetical protein